MWAPAGLLLYISAFGKVRAEFFEPSGPALSTYLAKTGMFPPQAVPYVALGLLMLELLTATLLFFPGGGAVSGGS